MDVTPPTPNVEIIVQGPAKHKGLQSTNSMHEREGAGETCARAKAQAEAGAGAGSLLRREAQRSAVNVDCQNARHHLFHELTIHVDGLGPMGIRFLDPVYCRWRVVSLK